MRTYRDTFFAAYGFGPYECFLCRTEIQYITKFDIHHLNEDKQNNHPYNLAAMHRPCHMKWHGRNGYNSKRTAGLMKGASAANSTPEAQQKRKLAIKAFWADPVRSASVREKRKAKTGR